MINSFYYVQISSEGSLLTANRNGVDLTKLAVLRVITNVIYSIFKVEETSSGIM